jgi:hypothetical protein
MNFTTGAHCGLFTIEQVLEIKRAVSRIGNKLQRPAISILALVVVLLAILPHSWMHTETTDEHLD